MKAIWKNVVIAESDETVLFEQHYYFPPESVRMEFLEKSQSVYHCPDRGYADVYDVVVDGKKCVDSARMYPHPYPQASIVKGKFTFWSGVEVAEGLLTR